MNDNNGMAIIGVIVGAILVLLVALYAFGALGPRKDATNINVETTAPQEIPAPAPEPAPATPEPEPAAPAPEPSSTPEPTPPTDEPAQPTEPS